MGLKTDLAKTHPPIPKGWRTSAQWAEYDDMSIDQTQRALRKLVASGTYEMKPWHVREASGAFKPHPIYRKKPGK